MNYQEYKKVLIASIEKDALEKSRLTCSMLISKRGGKFKVSEKQFIEELANMWVAGELSGIERILRIVEGDSELDSKDLIRGEIQLLFLATYKILKRRMNLKTEINLEDLLWGDLTTDKLIQQSRDFS